MAIISYDRGFGTEATTVTGLTPADAYTLGVALYHEGLPHLSYHDIVREVDYAARSAVIHVLYPVCVQILATAEEVEEMRIIGAEEVAARSTAFVARMNEIENIEERADAIIAARGRWDGA